MHRPAIPTVLESLGQAHFIGQSIKFSAGQPRLLRAPASFNSRPKNTDLAADDSCSTTAIPTDTSHREPPLGLF